MFACTIPIFKPVGKASRTARDFRPALGLVLALALGAGTVMGQAPEELILKGKVRDFVESNPTRTPAHPHFYGTRAHQAGCSSQEAGVNIAQVELDTLNDIGDTAVFKGDNRGPKLVAPLDAKVAGCFDPVARFSDWYNDRPTGDVNRAFLIDIRFVRNASGAYEYFDDNFFPLDSGKAYTRLGANAPYGHLLPAPDAAHNYGFTMEFHANFTYFKGTNQTFNFRGDDDVWAFINGKRVIDLGGIHAAQDANVNLDNIAAAIGLQDSLVYPLDFFFAERHVTTSKLRITTTLELQPIMSKPVVTPGGLFQGQVTVTATHPSPQAVIRYTSDGSAPNDSSPIFSGPLELTATTTLKFIATRPGYRSSEVVTETYTRMETVPTPVANPASRGFVEPLTVSLSVPGHADAQIRYTLDNSEPTASSDLYAGPLTFAATLTLKAKAFLTDWVPSAVMTEVYTDASTLPVPVADPAGTGFVGSQIVSLSVPGHPDAQIRYTLDGSMPSAASPLYSAALTLDKTLTLKARAFKADWKPSQPMSEDYRRLAVAVNAVYVDNDGDGRIDGAVVRLDLPVADLPASIRLVDPFSRAPHVLTAAAISKGAGADILIVRFPDQPFTPGTAFPTEALGSFPGIAGYGFTPFPVADSAGPVPVKAVSHNKTSPEAPASVDITFSEQVNLAEIQNGLLWPFDVIRKDGVNPAGLKVLSVAPVAGQPNTYRWTFTADSPVWIVYTDSLVLAGKPVIHDAGGNPSVGGGKRIPVEGTPEVLKNKIIIQVTNVTEQISKTYSDRVFSSDVLKNPFAGIGTGPGGSDVCLNCPRGSDQTFLDNNLSRPEWILKSKYAFQYSFTIYDHMGQYVNKTQGRIDEAMMAKLTQDAEGFRSIRFRWIPVASNGSAVGTGAYILKGVVLNKENEEQTGSQGEPQLVKQTQTAVFATFGFLRPR